MSRKLGWMVLVVLLILMPVAAESAESYTNPVAGNVRMGDPFVFVDEGRYFLYGTTSVNEGFKCWSSRDLVEWEPHGFAYRATSKEWGGKTFWAPEVFKYGDRYYMVYSSQPADSEIFGARICLAVADAPTGPFVELHAPLFDEGVACIDGHVFVDSDGTPYLFFDEVGEIVENGRNYLSGVIYGARLLPDLSGIAAEPVRCLKADQPWELPPEGRSRCNEGAFVFREGDRYYMTYSANHYVEPEYGIGYATASSPLGPWQKSAANPFVSSDLGRGLSGPGHNCVITTPDGIERFMVYHAHADSSHPSGERTVNIDRLVIEADGDLRLVGPTRTPQPLPSRR